MAFKDFGSASAYLESLVPVNIKSFFGIKRILALLNLMGNPQDSYATVHVGGTAGKGSTATIIAKILQCSGYKVGLHVSPHLEDMRERAQVNGELMTKSEFVDLVNRIKPYIERVSKQYKYGVPTYFEALLALTFQHFKDSNVEIAVIEVGLGGTLDGTNVIEPKVAILTNVGLEHTEVLGNTVEEIARDKAGIFKKGADIVSGVTQPSVVKIVDNKARKLHCDLLLIGRDIRYNILDIGLSGTVFNLEVMGLSFKGLTTSLLGEHQVINAALAISAVLKLSNKGFNVKESDIRSALLGLEVPGRFEIIGKNPTVVLDCAHNPTKTRALVTALKEYYPKKDIYVVFAVKKDKNVKLMLKQLSHIARAFYFTRFSSFTDFGIRMAREPRNIPQVPNIKCMKITDPRKAYTRAMTDAGKNGIICITGSMYLVGELRTFIRMAH